MMIGGSGWCQDKEEKGRKFGFLSWLEDGKSRWKSCSQVEHLTIHLGWVVNNLNYKPLKNFRRKRHIKEKESYRYTGDSDFVGHQQNTPIPKTYS